MWRAVDDATHCQRIYERLRDAAPVAVRVTDLWREGRTKVHEHVRALRAAGHSIEQVQIGDDKTWGWRMTQVPPRPKPMTNELGGTFRPKGAKLRA